MTYHVARDGTQLGTFNEDEVRQGLAGGRFLPTDLIWAEGMADWQPASSLGVPAVSPPPVVPRPVSAARPNLPNLPQHGGAVVSAEACGQATASMVLGILALLMGCLSGIPAVICGHIAINKINRSGGTLGGKGRAVTGLVLGYLSSLCFFPFLLGLAVPAFDGVKVKSEQLVAANQGRQVIIALKSYAVDHEGHYPPDLNVLVSEHLLSDESALTFPPITRWQGEPGWDYLGASLTDSSPGDAVLISSKCQDTLGKRIVGYNDSQVKTERPKEASP